MILKYNSSYIFYSCFYFVACSRLKYNIEILLKKLKKNKKTLIKKKQKRYNLLPEKDAIFLVDKVTNNLYSTISQLRELRGYYCFSIYTFVRYILFNIDFLFSRADFFWLWIRL